MLDRIAGEREGLWQSDHVGYEGMHLAQACAPPKGADLRLQWGLGQGDLSPVSKDSILSVPYSGPGVKVGSRLLFFPETL